jgi:hypothetical protein
MMRAARRQELFFREYSSANVKLWRVRMSRQVQAVQPLSGMSRNLYAAKVAKIG